ncbi:cellulose synthase-like protein G3 [Tanacetum coccineum]
MATPLFHSSKPLSKTWLNRIFSIVYAAVVFVHLTRHFRQLLRSPTPITVVLFVADFILAFLWLTSQCFHWRPIERKVFLENLRQAVAESEYPGLDIIVCTADPTKEPPVGVVNTALSVLAYEYPTEKLSVYISDDGGSEMTLYAFMECAKFAKHWIPYCKKHNIVDRSPEVYFGSDYAWFSDTDEIKAMYENMKLRVEAVVKSGVVSLDREMESELEDAFSKWTPNFTGSQHPTVIQSLLDSGVDKDVEGGVMPNLIYVTREKRNNKAHNYKAGALNVMLRVSGIMTNAPIVLVQDCDMYSNDPETPLRALCYFLDPKVDPKLAFVQFPQRYHSINKNDIYANEFKAETQILSLGMDGLVGAQYMGTGGFLNRHVISDSLSISVTTSNVRVNASSIKSKELLISAYKVASCDFEENTSWGSEIGFRYGTLTEDTYTSFRLHCEGWKSVFCNPKRAAFVGGSPSTLNDSLTQIQRWYMGFLEIFFNKYCPITYGIRSMNPLQALCYTHYTLRPFWMIPICIYAFLPQISLINSFPIFTKDSEEGLFLYAFLFLGAYGKEILDYVVFGGGTMQRWWSYQRMWLMWGLSSLPFALLEWSLKTIALSSFGFNVTSKVVDEEQNRLYEQGVFDFGVTSLLFFPISVASVINLLSFLRGMFDVFRMGRSENLFVQIFIAGFAVVNSWPIYEGMVIRKDRGRMPLTVTITSISIAIAICLASAVWDCGTNKSPGPDGFTFEFNRKYWNLIDHDVVAAVTSFFSTGTFPPGCNSSFIALIPKSQEAKMVKDFRHISLIGSMYKIITKILANRLSLVISELVSDVQSAFVFNRQILDGPFILNELLSWFKHKNTKALIFKIDFKKAFDLVIWDYLDVVLNYFGFGPKWRSWIQGCLNSAVGSILVNGSPTSKFKFFKGLKQGDHLSPFLFILIMESLHVGLYNGIHIDDSLSLSHLFYADDVIFIGKWNLSNLSTIVNVLKWFYLASGLKINLYKSKLMGIGIPHDVVASISN